MASDYLLLNDCSNHGRWQCDDTCQRPEMVPAVAAPAAVDIFMIKCCTNIEFAPYCVAEGLNKPRKQQGEGAMSNIAIWMGLGLAVTFVLLATGVFDRLLTRIEQDDPARRMK
ncbi:hypothetical protein F8A90_11435 [Cobetia sp. cqz5-12]|uniref:hypothetical protein n=1 Tax=Cobetia sp. cqz5-12 TaxID=2609415 RepID=UPI001906062C|nr:hypothetical protein [Cobetia sp. cqz5-12]QQK64674.1 hypothetical protein F8A90_11435 [Cobetia sp. cqz5-12]